MSVLRTAARGANYVRRLFRPLAISKLGFDVVHGCQLRCVGCPNSTRTPKVKFVSLEDFDLCLRNLDVSEIKTFRMFNFGEAFLHPELPELVRRARRAGPPVRTLEISTNAQCQDFDKLARVFETGQLNHLVVSCDGDGTPEDYERLRPPATWDKLLTFLREAKRLRDKHAPQVSLITRSICVDPAGRQRWEAILGPLGWSPQFRDWLNLAQSREQRGKPAEGKRGLCLYLSSTQHCYVDCDGTVVPCCAHPRAFTLGNLKTMKFSEIVAGEQRATLVRLLEAGREELDICRNCGI